MLIIRHNPILYIVAAFLGAFSSLRILQFITDQPSFNYSFFFVWHMAVICVSIMSLFLLPIRPHVTASKEELIIRESLIKKQIKVQISEIVEAIWGKQTWGFWTRGRMLLLLKLRNDQELHFYSLATLSKKKRNELFQHLQDAGIKVSIESVPNH